MEWIIGGLIAAAVGTAMQTYAQQSANRKAQAKMNAAQYALGDAQDRINDKIMSAASEYESGKRETNQQAEAERIAGDIKTDIAESQAIRDEQQETAGNVSSDYERARAKSLEDTRTEANAFADLIGKIRSAGTTRMNEGFKLNRYGQDIGMLAKNAQGDYAVGVAKAQDALHSKDGLANFGKIVSALGALASSYGALAGASMSAAGAAGAGASALGSIAGSISYNDLNTSTGSGSAFTAGETGKSNLQLVDTLGEDYQKLSSPLYLNGKANPWSLA